jgi:hypothetical protein
LAAAGLNSIEHILRKAQMVFNRWSKLPDAERSTDSFVEMMDGDYFKLLDAVTIARSRKHVEKYYNLEEIGKFPIRRRPVNIYADIDNEKEFPPLEQINKSIKRLRLAVYAPLAYLLPEQREKYSKKYDMRVADGQGIFRQTDRENQLVNLIRVNLLKRMESSIHSFALTLGKIINQIDRALENIAARRFEYDPELDITEIDLDNESQYEDLVFGNKVKVLLQDLDLIKWEQDLRDDWEQLRRLLTEAQKVTPQRDAKLTTLKAMLADKVQHPFNTANRKVLIFTAFADTADYLYDNLAVWVRKEFALHSAIVNGADQNHSTLKTLRRKDLNSILSSFSPRSKERSRIYPELTEEITDLTFNDFKIDLMDYLKGNREKLAQTPNGMYAIAALDDTLRDQICPGVIFTLKQVKGAGQDRDQNPFFPYFMVYITADGEVRYNYLHLKKLLDFYKKLCSGKKTVATELARQFNVETADGKNMQRYSALLETVIEDILGKKEELGVASLFSKGGTTLQKNAFAGLEEFELISFLIIKS